MNIRHKKLKILISCLIFFLLIAAIVTVAVLICTSIMHLENKYVAIIMFFVIVALSLICTVVDSVRRHYTVKKPVEKILAATDRIAAGDFTVRLETTHRLKSYNDYDCIAENINKVAAELSKNELLKNDFISSVSHEIKTPLAVIRSYAAAMQNENLSAGQRKYYADTLTEASARLTDLVTNILKLNKLENQAITPELKPVKLHEHLADCVLGFEEHIESKKLKLSCDFEEVTAVTCPDYLEIVWNNLLSNAIKFTPEGGNINVSLKRENGCAVIKFADTGCGISPETGKRIFDKFYQGDTSHAKEGNGLGLALVKKVIDILGGEISVESAPGKGSVFTVKINEKGK